jgi:hypothetical protein
MSFKVGEVCVIINAKHNRHMIGSECTVIEDIKEHRATDGDVFFGYRVDVHGYPSTWPDKSWLVRPEWLRLKRPPQELGSWSDISHIWNPKREIA